MHNRMAGTNGYITVQEATQSFRDGFDSKLFDGGQ